MRETVRARQERRVAAARPSGTLITFVAVCLGGIVVFLDVSVVNVATTAMARQLHGTVTDLEWVVNGYTLTFGALLLTAGTLTDRIGATTVFRAGFALFGLASLASALAPSLPVLAAARFVQGVGGALLIPSALAILRATYPDHARRTRAIGVWSAIAGSVALAAGPVVGGALVSQFGWRSIFLVNLPITAVGCWLVRGATARSARSLDLTGQLLAVLSLGSLTTAIVEAGRLGWASPLVDTCLAVFVVALAAFVYAESRTAAPMMPLRMYGSGGFTVATAVAALVNISFYGLLFVLSLFFQRTWHESPIAAGLAFLPMTASIMLGNLTSGTLIRRFGARATIVAASALAAVGYGAAFPAVGGHSYVWLAVPLLLVGASAGVVVPATTNAVLSAVDPESAGTAAGAFNTLRQLGGIVGVAVMGLVAGAGTAAGVGACVLLAGATQVVSVILAAAGIRGSSSR